MHNNESKITPESASLVHVVHECIFQMSKRRPASYSLSPVHECDYEGVNTDFYLKQIVSGQRRKKGDV